MKLAVISDLHFSLRPDRLRTEHADLTDIFLFRAVHRLNRWIRPDATVLLGDLLQDPENEIDAGATMQKLKQAVDKLTMPTIVLPGNHDLEPAEFGKTFPPPDDWLDIKGVRLVPFIDEPRPGYNAFRSPDQTEKMRQAGRNWSGPLVSLQHVPLFAPGRSDCPYNYLNATELLAIMKEYGYCLSLGGHYHKGMQTDLGEQPASIACPAFCDEPFPFLVIDIGRDQTVTTSRHQLQLPETALLTDNHVHTQFAYCSENMDIMRGQRIARAMKLRQCRFTEHSGQLYFDAETFWTARFMDTGVAAADIRQRRMDDYFQQLQKDLVPPTAQGLEVDCDFNGRPVLTGEDRLKSGFLLGAMHWLPATRDRKKDFDPRQAGREMLFLAERFLASGLTVLAHPFRVFNRGRQPLPREIFVRLARLLKQHRVAAELNFHTQEPAAEFVQICLETGVRLSLGSDAHNLYEIGELYPHLQLLQKLGVGITELTDVLISGTTPDADWKQTQETVVNHDAPPRQRKEHETAAN